MHSLDIDERGLVTIILTTLFVGLFLGFFYGHRVGFDRGIKMMGLSSCDEEIARDIDQAISHTGN